MKRSLIWESGPFYGTPVKALGVGGLQRSRPSEAVQLNQHRSGELQASLHK